MGIGSLQSLIGCLRHDTIDVSIEEVFPGAISVSISCSYQSLRKEGENASLCNPPYISAQEEQDSKHSEEGRAAFSFFTVLALPALLAMSTPLREE